jgi:hypothetical protein
MTMMKLALILPLLSLACSGADGIGEDDEELSAGVNGAACTASPYNCKLRASGGNRIETNTAGDITWDVVPGAMLRDGEGNALVPSTSNALEFNYGQTRSFGGVEHAFAMATSNGSAAWFPISSIQQKTLFGTKVGHVSAHGVGLAKMGCYEIKNSYDTSIELKKVVYDSQSTHERAGDYLPLLRANGKHSANLTFNVPGFGLGGVAIDHFPAGTKFQRLDVPTKAGPPSIDIPLYVKDSQGRYRKQDGTLKFIYGYVISATGTKRDGWMAYPALQVSSNCP